MGYKGHSMDAVICDDSKPCGDSFGQDRGSGGDDRSVLQYGSGDGKWKCG